MRKKVIEALSQEPEGVALEYSYLRADMAGVVCVWRAKSAEQIRDITKLVPEMKTDVVPAFQFFSPSADVYTITHSLIS